MDTSLLSLLGSGLACLWVLAPIVIIQYFTLTVPKGLDDIRNVFLWSLLPPGKTELADDRGKNAAWHYARLQGFFLNQDGKQAERASIRANRI